MARAKKKKEPKKFRVYCTYTPEGTYYIGFSSKTDAQYEKYFGSNRAILEKIKESPDDHGYIKETIGEYQKQSHAKFAEMLLQLKFRHDSKCLNDMIHLRSRLSYVKEIECPEWSPNPSLLQDC